MDQVTSIVAKDGFHKDRLYKWKKDEAKTPRPINSLWWGDS